MRHLLVTAILIALPAHARADDAKSHIARAKALHAEGKPAAALLELKTAYALDPQPSLLYAMGQIHVQLGECDTAITYYERFLDAKPAADLADLARQAIEACQTSPPPATATVTEEPAPAPPVVDPPAAIPAPIAPAPRTATRPWYRDRLGLALVGGGLVTGIAGLVVWTSARSDRDDADRAGTYDEFVSLVDRARGKQTAALVLGAAGVALVGAGAAHLYLHRKDEVLVVAPTAGGAAISWSGRW